MRSCVGVLTAKTILSECDIQPGKEILYKIVSMLVGLIKSNSTTRVCEPIDQYGRD